VGRHRGPSKGRKKNCEGEEQVHQGLKRFELALEKETQTTEGEKGEGVKRCHMASDLSAQRLTQRDLQKEREGRVRTVARKALHVPPLTHRTRKM